MRRIGAGTALVLCATFVSTTDASSDGYAITFGAKSKVCQALYHRLGKVPYEDFLNGKAGDAFDPPQVDGGYFTYVARDGTRQSRMTYFFYLDLNNDGAREVVVAETSVLRSTDHHNWYVYSERDFKRHSMSEFPHTANPGFLSGVWSVQKQNFGVGFAYLYPWRFNRRTYVIAQDVYFRHSEHGPGAIALLTSDQSDISKGEDIGSKFRAVCRITVPRAMRPNSSSTRPPLAAGEQRR